jgi:hypothetical protein
MTQILFIGPFDEAQRDFVLRLAKAAFRPSGDRSYQRILICHLSEAREFWKKRRAQLSRS